MAIVDYFPCGFPARIYEGRAEDQNWFGTLIEQVSFQEVGKSTRQLHYRPQTQLAFVPVQKQYMCMDDDNNFYAGYESTTGITSSLVSHPHCLQPFSIEGISGDPLSLAASPYRYLPINRPDPGSLTTYNHTVDIRRRIDPKHRTTRLVRFVDKMVEGIYIRNPVYLFNEEKLDPSTFDKVAQSLVWLVIYLEAPGAGNYAKFWEITIPPVTFGGKAGLPVVTRRWGKKGYKGQSTRDTYDNRFRMIMACADIITAKIAAGYRPVLQVAEPKLSLKEWLVPTSNVDQLIAKLPQTGKRGIIRD